MISKPVCVAAGTTNPAKLEAIQLAAAEFFDEIRVRAIPIDPGVPEQPWSDEQTAEGALMRARGALSALDVDFGIGLESGLVDGPGGRIYVVSWAAAVDGRGRTGFGSSERFPLPVHLELRLRAGAELGPLIDEMFGQPGLARADGAVSIFTAGRRTRTEILSVAVLQALAALLEPWHVTP